MMMQYYVSFAVFWCISSLRIDTNVPESQVNLAEDAELGLPSITQEFRDDFPQTAMMIERFASAHLSTSEFFAVDDPRNQSVQEGPKENTTVENEPERPYYQFCITGVVAGPDYEKMFEISGASWSKYAAKHGYSFEPVHIKLDFGDATIAQHTHKEVYMNIQDTMWHSVLKSFVEKGCAYTVLTDMDSMVINHEVPLSRLIQEDADLMMPTGDGNAKGGFRILRNSEVTVRYAHDLLSTMRSPKCLDGRPKPQDGNEQAAMACVQEKYQHNFKGLGNGGCGSNKGERRGSGGVMIFGNANMDHDTVMIAEIWGMYGGEGQMDKLKVLSSLRECTKWSPTDHRNCADCGWSASSA